MNCHQILSGACNAGDKCFAIGSVEGIAFTAYAAGCNIVILARNFERVQIIPGANHGYIKISAIDCSTDTGKIAAAYESKICIFEPTPLLQSIRKCAHFLEYRWVKTGFLLTASHILTLSWNLEGTRLLTGGQTLQLWKEVSIEVANEATNVMFVIGGDRETKTPTIEISEEPSWKSLWMCETATSVYHMAFSHDGTLFATCGRNDRLVKIWYENKQVLFPSSNTDKGFSKDDVPPNYTYVYIAHPRAVTQLTWRKTSKYMPKGSVSNMIITSCLDNICRIWIETVLPDDGLINMTQFDPLTTENPKFRTHRHKHRFVQRLKHMKACFHVRRHVKNGSQSIENGFNELLTIHDHRIPSLPSSCSVHDFHSYGYHGTGVSPGMHFHLAASINAETDIPLVPTLKPTSSYQNSFILHWLNNKEMYFSLRAESILQELTKKVLYEENKCHTAEDKPNKEPESQTACSYSQARPMESVEMNYDVGNGKSTVSTSWAENSISKASSLSSLKSENTTEVHHFADSLDVKIDSLLRDWHQDPDLLFSIHPIDGSFLIWIVEWLDDFFPGSFRQAQVSFSTRIPSALPLGDSSSLSPSIALFLSSAYPISLKEINNALKGCNSNTNECSTNADIEKSLKKSSSINTSEKGEYMNAVNALNTLCPSVSMVTKHSNGTLNLWQLNFSLQTKFTQVLSIGHNCRASGHRFRVNDITCHPVLPLLVSTSHHNLPDTEKKDFETFDNQMGSDLDVFTPSGFCSELILWKVEPVGPLCYSGGVSELARINSPNISAFSNVAWIPTLLPSTTLGNYFHSPSACFVASDGENLRVYQAVIDARSLLAELSSSSTMPEACSRESLNSNSSSNCTPKQNFKEKLKVVSQQSTSRPGCVIELDAISDAKHDWQNTQFLHVFQEQLIINGTHGEYIHSSDSTEGNTLIDCCDKFVFEKFFFIVIIEKTLKGSTLHMWRITMSSVKPSSDLADITMYVPDSSLTQEIDDTEIGCRHFTTSIDPLSNVENSSPNISIITEKVCTQELPLPDGVDVIHTSPAAGHLSSSSIYPACLAPYIIVTACSDSISRFWKCDTKNVENITTFRWCEWKMSGHNGSSAIDIPGQPLNISAAYSGRVACAYKYGKSFTRPTKGDPESRYVNLCVGIYECESTGGCEWILEDTIHLKNIYLPRINIDHSIDFSVLHDSRFIKKKQRLHQMLHTITHDENRTPRSGETTPEGSAKTAPGLLAIPSFSTLQSLRKSIAENGNTCPLTQKHLVQLDWVSKEDGSHILTVAVGSKILLYTPVSSDIAQANIKAMKESKSGNRPLLRKASSLAQSHFNDEIRWMKLRQIDLETADGLPALPMQISWVRDGILVVAMDSETHVYSQWKPKNYHNTGDLFDTRNLRDEDIRSLPNEKTSSVFRTTASMPLMNKISESNLQHFRSEKKKKSGSIGINTQSSADATFNCDYMTDVGLFQASRVACPVLPQYHPKQLMELLNSGKIHWVKAILAHLVRCVRDSIQNDVHEEEVSRQRSWSRSRTLSISYVTDANFQGIEHRGSTTQVPEELMLDYTEISSIPPLPLWALLYADEEPSTLVRMPSQGDRDYNALFERKASEEDLDNILDEDEENLEGKFSLHERQNAFQFGPRQGQLLSRFLTHSHLPGLSSLDQMHLLALADTVASCNSHLSEQFSVDHGRPIPIRDTSRNASTDSLDYCGLRFLLAMKHFTYLIRCLPITQRAQFQKNGIGTSNIVWAFHSESEEELLSLIPSYTKDIKWSVLRELGVGYWLRNINTLRQCVERLAKCAYQAMQDPLDAAIYYLAMKKKSIVWGLFRSKRDEKMTSFFSNNFNEDRWRKAALKNAFVLLGKQRFEHAVAFFLLANSLSDAVEVCINKLEDFQLALIISRLYEGDVDLNSSSMYKNLLHERVLGFDVATKTFDSDKAHPDPFLRSMAYWTFEKYSESLNTLLLNRLGVNHISYKVEEIFPIENSVKNPNVFNFYIYLRTHPLLVRHNLAVSVQENKMPNVILSGFFQTKDDDGPTSANKQLHIENGITPSERQLYFTTAHAHVKAGCPILALEVLNKLPIKISAASSNSDSQITYSASNLIHTGMLASCQEGVAVAHTDITGKSLNTPVDYPISTEIKQMGIRCGAENLNKNPYVGGTRNKTESKHEQESSRVEIDVMAQQLKFIACLKVMMEELSTLATGFEVDGGQLRYQLYIWLEKEVDGLKKLCGYGLSNSTHKESGKVFSISEIALSDVSINEATLHDILLQEKMDFEAKVQRAEKRKQWLKSNETLLRTLLSYCSLHGASGGGLASVRMELILLLQELHQEKTQQQLLSPLPFPTTLPLLSACVAGNKTVTADPIKYLQSQTYDMLQSIIKISPFPVLELPTFCEICVLRDLGIALSSCIYQSLCDSESFVVSKRKANEHCSPAFECSYLVSNANAYTRRRNQHDESTSICTTPSKWPGVTNLRALLARDKDEDIPKLNILLLESFMATYISLTIYALSSCDSRMLYRLVGRNYTKETWAKIFGGGMKQLVRKPTKQTAQTPTDNLQQRTKLNLKFLGSLGSYETTKTMKEDKATFREKFSAPEMSMASYFLTKPQNSEFDDYDSDDPIDETSDNEDESFLEGNTINDITNKGVRENTEHVNPTSFSWCILRIAVIKLILRRLQDFVKVAGVDMSELPVLSPLCHEVFRVLQKWRGLAENVLNGVENVNNVYVQGISKNTTNDFAEDFESLLKKENTPFVNGPSTASIRRLWTYLLNQECVQDTIIRSIIGRSIANANKISTLHRGPQRELEKGAEPEHIRIIHKTQESIFSFCLNNNSSGLISFATPREIQEMDISLLLESPHWSEDECDYDMLNISKEADVQSSAFLVIQASESSQVSGSEPILQSANSQQSGRGTSLIMRHKIDNVKRMSSHPLLPLYIAGGQDGSVHVWEWGHQQIVCAPRASGTFAKVTRCKFSDHGNKFGVADGDGNLSLWQAGLASNTNKPYYNYQCHNKTLSDFAFLGSCSLLATAGQSSENKNINVWDTLLPQKKSCITTFACHEQGASGLVFAPQHQVLISSGKKGDVYVFDLRQRTLKHRFQAHDTTIKCIALDPYEEYFATGSVEGDIKIWSLQQYSLLKTFDGEHAKSSFFKHVGQGVSKICIDASGRLFSCGSDGCLKVRQLMERDEAVLSLY